jgi:hypothetical protein
LNCFWLLALRKNAVKNILHISQYSCAKPFGGCYVEGGLLGHRIFVFLTSCYNSKLFLNVIIQVPACSKVTERFFEVFFSFFEV